MNIPGVDLWPPDEFLTTTPATRVEMDNTGALSFHDPPEGYGEPIERMDPPDPANVRLDPRLMTHQRLLDLVGTKMVRFKLVHGDQLNIGWRPSLDLYLDCAECGQGITAGRPTSPVQFAADVLRHYVTAHGMSLSGAPGAAEQEAATDGT